METEELGTFQGLAVLPDSLSLQDGMSLTGWFKEPVALLYSEFTSPKVPLNDQ